MEYKALPFSSVWENGIFNLPIKVVDEYLKLASEYQLKALLYIFRNNGQAETAKIAKALGQTIADTDNLLEFWVEEGIISKNGEIVESTKIPQATAPAEKNVVVVKETFLHQIYHPKILCQYCVTAKNSKTLLTKHKKYLAEQ